MEKVRANIHPSDVSLETCFYRRYPLSSPLSSPFLHSVPRCSSVNLNSNATADRSVLRSFLSLFFSSSSFSSFSLSFSRSFVRAISHASFSTPRREERKISFSSRYISIFRSFRGGDGFPLLEETRTPMNFFLASRIDFWIGHVRFPWRAR